MTAETQHELLSMLRADMAAQRKTTRELLELLRDQRDTNREMLELMRALRVELVQGVFRRGFAEAIVPAPLPLPEGGVEPLILPLNPPRKPKSMPRPVRPVSR